MQQPSKVCPVVLRYSSEVEVLAFEHPLAGRQLVKGTIEPGETPAQAAVRELYEEAGILARVVGDLGLLNPGGEHVWSFQLCAPLAELEESWVHHAPDDGGHDFRFFWLPLSSRDPEGVWHVQFLRALAHIRSTSSNKLFDTDAQVRPLPSVAPSLCAGQL
jgi:8-oxo-dGTP pyrophosphatase MutT (NUDIX family)